MAGKRKHSDMIWLPANQVWTRMPANLSVPAAAMEERIPSSHTTSAHVTMAPPRRQRRGVQQCERNDSSVAKAYQRCRWTSPEGSSDERDEHAEPNKRARHSEVLHCAARLRDIGSRGSISPPPSEDAVLPSLAATGSPLSSSSPRSRPHGKLPAPGIPTSPRAQPQQKRKDSRAASAATAMRVALSSAGQKYELERYTGFDLAEELTAEELAEAVEELYEPLPNCPICETSHSLTDSPSILTCPKGVPPFLTQLSALAIGTPRAPSWRSTTLISFQ